MGDVAGEMEGDSILERRASIFSPQSFLLEALETSFSTCMAAVVLVTGKKANVVTPC